MTPEAFVDFASQLAARPDASAAAYRSAISRAYYGAYHQARDFLESHLQISCKAAGSEHFYLLKLLSNSGVNEAIDLATELSNLLASRKKADYDLKLDWAESQKNSQFCVERAKSILSGIDTCRIPPLSEVIKTGILAYKKRTNS